MKVPNSRFQIPSGETEATGYLVLKNWSCSGTWNLELGILFS